MNKSVYKQLTKMTPYIISAASLIFAAQFLYHTVNSSLSSRNVLWILLPVLTSILAIIGLRSEFKIVRAIELNKEEFRLPTLVKSITIITSSAMITYFIADGLRTTTIFAASFVCVLFAFIFSNNEAEAYSGTVAGMIGAYLCEHWSVALVTALVTALVFIFFKPYFKGVGGRGGSIPYVGTTLVVRMLFRLEPIQSKPIDPALIFPSFFILLFIAFLTYSLHKYHYLSVVKSAMIIALISSIVIPHHLYTLTTVVFAGTIVGMSIENRVSSYFHLLIVVIICFILFVPAFHILDGIGGKLGILSLLSYYGSIGLKQTIYKMHKFSTDLVRLP